MKVLIAHPTRQHSHRLAQALQQAGMLHSYWSLLPDRRTLSWIPASFDRLLPSAVMRHSLQFLPPDKVHILSGPLLFQKLALRASSVAFQQLGEWAAWAAFDFWVARNLPRLQPVAVVGYEMCCAETFRVAKKLGIACVLDAAAFHYAMQDNLLDEEKISAQTWAGVHLRRRKAKEVMLSDRIICVSEIARRSYVDAGVDEAKLIANFVGCDLAKFTIDLKAVRAGAPKFVFVGLPGYRKGFDLLIESYIRVLVHYPSAELHVVGDPPMAKGLPAGGRISIHGKLSHDGLSKLLSKMDCLVLPSRLESFGMVVTEALAVGVPAIVSDHVGASVAIREGENGWIVPAGNQDALFQQMLACCNQIEQVRKKADACRRSAHAYDWSNYYSRSVEIFSGLVEA